MHLVDLDVWLAWHLAPRPGALTQLCAAHVKARALQALCAEGERA